MKIFNFSLSSRFLCGFFCFVTINNFRILMSLWVTSSRGFCLSESDTFQCFIGLLFQISLFWSDFSQIWAFWLGIPVLYFCYFSKTGVRKEGVFILLNELKMMNDWLAYCWFYAMVSCLKALLTTFGGHFLQVMQNILKLSFLLFVALTRNRNCLIFHSV